MKRVDATWEMRNLGLRVVEICFEDRDEPTEIGNLPIQECDYLVAKLPVTRIELVHVLEDAGFRFMETQFELSCELQGPLAIPKTNAFEMLLRRMLVMEVRDEAGLFRILQRVTPALFDTDRISLDPSLGPEKGALRYRNWIVDEFFNRNARLCELILGDRPIGFFLLSNAGDSQYYATLASLYQEFKKCGLGISIVAKPILYAAELKAKRITTRTSSNNPDSFKMHLMSGYAVRDIFYLFRWHKRNGKIPWI